MTGLAHYQKPSIMMPFKNLQTNGQSVLRSRGTLLRNNMFVMSKIEIQNIWGKKYRNVLKIP